jgi:hypothetical protein
MVKYVDIVIKGDNNQDWGMTVAVFDALHGKLFHLFPRAASIYVQSDNATHYSGSSVFRWVIQRNQEWRAAGQATIARWIFTEAQRGKTALDGHNSFVSMKLDQFVRRGMELSSSCNFVGPIL